MVGHLLFLLYMNDLPVIINNESIPVLFAADTTVIFIHSDFIAYKNKLKKFLLLQSFYSVEEFVSA